MKDIKVIQLKDYIFSYNFKDRVSPVCSSKLKTEARQGFLRCISIMLKNWNSLLVSMRQI